MLSVGARYIVSNRIDLVLVLGKLDLVQVRKEVQYGRESVQSSAAALENSSNSAYHTRVAQYTQQSG